MKADLKPTHAPFGALLGVASGGVPVYSSDYPSADKSELPTRHDYRSYVDGIFMGYKWQCVELARRWVYINKGYIFDDIAMAYDIFRLRTVRVVADNTDLPLRSFKNGAKRHPEPGSLLIWNEGGEFDVTGHVAIVSEVFPDRIRVVEQNVEDRVWPAGQNYSRELKAWCSEDGAYRIDCSYDDASVLGWVTQTDDPTHAEEIVDVDPRLFNLTARELRNRGRDGTSWLDQSSPDEAAYIAMMGGCKLTSNDADQYKYFCVGDTALKEIKRATNELHAMFMHATDYVLQDDTLLRKFNLPPALWPRIHESWDNRRNQMITGRFDLSVSEHGIKVYEYNADSASCHMECGKVQEKWARHFGCRVGRSSGEHLSVDLVDAWQESGVEGVLHIMQDQDLEETYHALYMKAAIDKAGIPCKIIRGTAGLGWDDEGCVVDADGVRINWVWKTWAWETALDQIRAEFADDEDNIRLHRSIDRSTTPPRLVDVLLRKEVMVFEPLWTLIPSNKAILPILWLLYPNHPYLLNTQYALTDDLRQKGYVSKPIVGRSGSNISIFDDNNDLIKETAGKFEDQDQIYQELFRLPRIDGYNVQVGTFSVAGAYGGTCLRVDPTMVITTNSDVLALRVVADKDLKLGGR